MPERSQIEQVLDEVIHRRLKGEEVPFNGSWKGKLGVSELRRDAWRVAGASLWDTVATGCRFDGPEDTGWHSARV